MSSGYYNNNSSCTAVSLDEFPRIFDSFLYRLFWRSYSGSTSGSEYEQNILDTSVEGNAPSITLSIFVTVIIPILVIIYLCAVLAVICDAHFVPTLEFICDRLNLHPDVAGATFMAAGTSSPEFFTNIIGTFVAKSDLGIGAIVGSAIFNIFGVIAICGIFGLPDPAKSRNKGSAASEDGDKVDDDDGNTDEKGEHSKRRFIPLDWYPITRDCIFYGITVIVLMLVLIDNEVTTYESLSMVLLYLLYIVLMAFNGPIEKFAYSFLASPSPHTTDDTNLSTMLSLQSHSTETIVDNSRSTIPHQIATDESKPLLSLPKSHSGKSSMNTSSSSRSSLMSRRNSIAASTTALYEFHVERPWFVPTHRRLSASNGYHLSLGAYFYKLLLWLIMLPTNSLLYITIPSVNATRCCDAFKTYQCGYNFSLGLLATVSFSMCMIWIGGISYLITWMITLLGFLLGVPDSVMGLSFLAIGTSLPEIISSLIVCKNLGQGSMAVSNSIGSNTFDILICLGLPWLIRSLLRTSSETSFLDVMNISFGVNSQGLAFTVANLFIALIILYILMCYLKFELSLKLGLISILIYTLFIVIAILFELNLIVDGINIPSCIPSLFQTFNVS